MEPVISGKPVSFSRTEQVQILTLNSINGFNRLFGGKLMEWIDVVAAVVARRHSGRNVTTAAVDNLQFRAPAFANDTIILSGYITYAGRTSMEVCVKTYLENLDGSRKPINKAYLVLVALDDEGNPTPVPPVIPETEEDQREYMEAQKRREFRKLRKAEHF
ncbi:MAG: acyl-CoA thioesterase [Oscillospiraceae bacterium]